MSNPQPTVLLGVTGCIAAYKACEIVRELQRRDIRVKVVMTDAATHFVGPATFKALTREPVAVSLWDEAGAPVHHVSLAQECDVMVIAPATANTVAAIAEGRAPDLLATTALATTAPMVIAPAMNEHMWHAEATCRNVGILESRGVTIVAPGNGELACGTSGDGRLAPVSDIVDAVVAQLGRGGSLAGRTVLITSGGTREAIDPVRFIGNPASGKTGFALALEARQRGARVVLISGPTEHADIPGVETVHVVSAREMLESVRERFAACDIFVSAAAVADFRPVACHDQKVSKEHAPLHLELERTTDILAEMGSRKGDRIAVGYAAETNDVVRKAQAKLERKNLDLVVANDVSGEVGFASADNRVWLIDHATEIGLPLMSKRQIAIKVMDRIADLLEPRR